MTTWSKQMKILALLTILTAMLVGVWLIMRAYTAKSDPQAVIAELTLGDTSKTNQPTPADPEKDKTISFLVAQNSETASALGISQIMTKQEVIDYYINWFNSNNWDIHASTQMTPDKYILLGEKVGEGRIQIDILDFHSDEGSVSNQGVLQVFIAYGFGR